MRQLLWSQQPDYQELKPVALDLPSLNFFDQKINSNRWFGIWNTCYLVKFY